MTDKKNLCENETGRQQRTNAHFSFEVRFFVCVLLIGAGQVVTVSDSNRKK